MKNLEREKKSKGEKKDGNRMCLTEQCVYVDL